MTNHSPTKVCMVWVGIGIVLIAFHLESVISACLVPLSSLKCM